MLGQTVGGEKSDFEKIRPKINAYALNAEKAEGLYSLIKFSSEEKVRSAANLTEAIAGYLYLNKLIEAGENTGSEIGAYVRGHLDGDLSANALCRAFKLSRVDLYACFKHTFSCTPAEYVKKARLSRACELLSTSLPITKIAQEIGICDYNYFSKIFKSSFALSPRAYRNRLKKG
jgi:YesN/AraC family two-component response regulator